MLQGTRAQLRGAGRVASQTRTAACAAPHAPPRDPQIRRCGVGDRRGTCAGAVVAAPFAAARHLSTPHQRAPALPTRKVRAGHAGLAASSTAEWTGECRHLHRVVHLPLATPHTTCLPYPGCPTSTSSLGCAQAAGLYLPPLRAPSALTTHVPASPLMSQHSCPSKCGAAQSPLMSQHHHSCPSITSHAPASVAQHNLLLTRCQDKTWAAGARAPFPLLCSWGIVHRIWFPHPFLSLVALGHNLLAPSPLPVLCDPF